MKRSRNIILLLLIISFTLFYSQDCHMQSLAHQTETEHENHLVKPDANTIQAPIQSRNLNISILWVVPTVFVIGFFLTILVVINVFINKRIGIFTLAGVGRRAPPAFTTTL